MASAQQDNDAAINAAIQQQSGAVVAMTNSTPLWIEFYTHNNWNGELRFGNYPGDIAPDIVGEFTHSGTDNNGSKGAVLYKRNNNRTAKPCGWLLAWSAPKYPSDSNPNRVYVKCGELNYLQNVTWNQIENLLNASSDISRFRDTSTGTYIDAAIIPGPNFASVGVTFGAE